MLPIYLSSSAFNYAAMTSYTNFSFLQYLRLSAFTSEHTGVDGGQPTSGPVSDLDELHNENQAPGGRESRRRSSFIPRTCPLSRFCCLARPELSAAVFLLECSPNSRLFYLDRLHSARWHVFPTRRIVDGLFARRVDCECDLDGMAYFGAPCILVSSYVPMLQDAGA